MAYKYKLVERPGIVAIILHGKKILLLKRRNVPLILNPGIWSFLSGGRDNKESYLNTAYREIYEEVKLPRSKLTLLDSGSTYLRDQKKGVMWYNRVFIFRSSTGKVRLDFENSAYRWASFGSILNEKGYTNVFINEEQLLSKIRRCLAEFKGIK